MCGIAGAFSPRPRRALEAASTMSGLLVHRGPDDDGLWSAEVPAGEVAFGFRRLAIQDLSPAGHQPMVHGPTGLSIVFNGEVYNFQALREELTALGATFRSRGDTEVVLEAYARWGVAAFARLSGMFAIAIFDPRAKTLTLARDAMGIKPLYYGFGPDGFAFASELRALRASGFIDPATDRRALATFLAYGAVAAPLTMLKHARLLEPGCFATLDLSHWPPSALSLREKRFWAIPKPVRPAPPEPEVRAEMAARLREAVRTHLISDVPVGVFLSSGIDSTAVATLAAELRGGDVDTFTVSFEGSGSLDEGPVAAATAARLGTRHHNVTVPEHKVVPLAEKWMHSVDQPTFDGLNTYLVSQAVRERGIVVALSGLGGDEIFGGYPSFREVPRLRRYARATSWIPSGLRAAAVDLLLAGRSDAQRRKGRDLATHTRTTLRSLYFRRRRLLSDAEVQDLGFDARELDLDDDFLPPESFPDRWTWPDEFPFSALRVLESRFYMGNMLLRDTDVFGMAHGLEVRVPLLDRSVIDYALTLPGEAWVDTDGPNKPLLVEAVGNIPPDIVRLAKRGFGLPQARWMDGPLRELFVDAFDRVVGSGLVETAAARQVWTDFQRDREGPTWSRAWGMGVLGRWLAAFGESHAPRASDAIHVAS